MKMLMIIVNDKFNDAVEATLEKHDVKGFTEIPMVYGEGTSGKKLGSRLHPGASSLVFTIVPDDKVESLKTALVAGCRLEEDCNNQNVHIVVLDVVDFV